MTERVWPVGSLQAAREGGRVPDEDNHVHVEPFGEPAGGEQGDWILHQCPSAVQPIIREVPVVASHSPQVFWRPDRPQLGDVFLLDLEFGGFQARLDFVVDLGLMKRIRHESRE